MCLSYMFDVKNSICVIFVFQLRGSFINFSLKFGSIFLSNGSIFSGILGLRRKVFKVKDILEFFFERIEKMRVVVKVCEDVRKKMLVDRRVVMK